MKDSEFDADVAFNMAEKNRYQRQQEVESKIGEREQRANWNGGSKSFSQIHQELLLAKGW